MSTLTIFLCAAALCIAQTIADTGNLDKGAVIGRIDQAIKNIDERATQVFRRVAELGPVDSEKLFDQFVPKQRGIAYDFTTTVKNLADRYILSSQLSREKKAECRAYYDTWADKFSDDVQGNMDASPYIAHYYADFALGTLLNRAAENKITLENLKVRVNVGNTTEWNDIIENVTNISTRSLNDAEKTRKYYESIVDGTGVIALLKVRTNWDQNFNSGVELLQKVFKCAKPVMNNPPSNAVITLPDIFD